MAETIYALASPRGRGGIAVVRVSGPQARESLGALTGMSDFPVRQAAYRRFRDPENGQVIDHGIALPFDAPHSFTGEDVVEYYLHGGMAIVREMLDVLSRQSGHRMAAPGEFTRRAFENNKMDLTEAEAVADLINAETVLQKAQALSQLEGGLSSLYMGWTETLKRALAYLEADLEFPDEDMPDGVRAQVHPVLKELVRDISIHLDDKRRGERLRDGVHVVIVGAPNVGKSSLINALAQRDVAIVSEHAGTTRDIIEAHLDLGGYPVIVSDTAGLRPEQLSDDGHGAIEGEGIRRALKRAGEADIKLLLFDACALPALDPHAQALIDGEALVAFNKCDIYNGAYPFEAIRLSAKTGDGLDVLINALVRKIASIMGAGEAVSLTRSRHRKALEECRDSLSRSLGAALPELAAEDVRLAIRALGRITGKIDAEDLLDVIFRDFCIGK